MFGNKTSAHQFLICTLVKRATLILSLENTALIDGIEHRWSSRTQELKQILTSPSVSVILTQTCPSESSATQLCYGNWTPCLPKLNLPPFPTLLVFSSYVEVEPCWRKGPESPVPLLPGHHPKCPRIIKVASQGERINNEGSESIYRLSAGGPQASLLPLPVVSHIWTSWSESLSTGRRFKPYQPPWLGALNPVLLLPNGKSFGVCWSALPCSPPETYYGSPKPFHTLLVCMAHTCTWGRSSSPQHHLLGESPCHLPSTKAQSTSAFTSPLRWRASAHIHQRIYHL